MSDTDLKDKSSSQSLTRLSKFCSLVLRHEPQAHGLRPDPNGWVNADDLVAAATRVGLHLEPALLRQIVATSDKRRFALSEDGLRIRANQGHSIAIDLARIFHQQKVGSLVAEPVVIGI